MARHHAAHRERQARSARGDRDAPQADRRGERRPRPRRRPENLKPHGTRTGEHSERTPRGTHRHRSGPGPVAAMMVRAWPRPCKAFRRTDQARTSGGRQATRPSA
ncbi:MAG: hypothetical protein MZV70_05560 [Desulfobacterales bacterium]|nr:hypothetical protein [Desulfobacterales bacterium]